MNRKVMNERMEEDKRKMKKKERKAFKEKEEEGEGEDYEKRPRGVPVEWKMEELKKTKLPVLGEDGKMHVVEDRKMLLKEIEAKEAREQAMEESEESGEEELFGAEDREEKEEEEEEELSETQKMEKGEEERLKVLAETDPDRFELELLQKRNRRIQERKAEIAVIANSIMEDPEKNLGKLAGLHKIFFDPDLTVKKLVLASQAALFKDIRPGYRLKALTEEEKKNVKFSKEVFARRKYEASLLEHYRKLLLVLENVLKIKKNGKDAQVKKLIDTEKNIC